MYVRHYVRACHLHFEILVVLHAPHWQASTGEKQLAEFSGFGQVISNAILFAMEGPTDVVRLECSELAVFRDT